MDLWCWLFLASAFIYCTFFPAPFGKYFGKALNHQLATNNLVSFFFWGGCSFATVWITRFLMVVLMLYLGLAGSKHMQTLQRQKKHTATGPTECQVGADDPGRVALPDP